MQRVILKRTCENGLFRLSGSTRMLSTTASMKQVARSKIKVNQVTGVVARSQASAPVRGATGGSPPPTFQRLPAPTKPVNEHDELIWDDGVAPEVTVDFDAPHVKSSTALAALFGAFTSIFVFYQFIKNVIDPPSLNPAAKRELPFDNLKVELGGYENPYEKN